jgi:spermidine/putrescine transport system ATP-binding protein
MNATDLAHEASASESREGQKRDLHLENITKDFATFTAVDDLSLTVPTGSFFALLGPSGCGKTTTLRMIAGLEEPTKGRILLGDQDVAGLKPYKRPINTVFQNYALFPHLTIADNIAFGLRRRGIRDTKSQVADMVKLVELGGQEHKRPTQLSGGQQQRVALGRALINQPDVLLLDEPLGALDLKLRRQMQIELKRIQVEMGITFVHVTHDQEEAMTMADTIAVMNRGLIEQMGAPEELYENPRSTFVANFLGQSNLVKGRVVDQHGDELVVDANGMKVAGLKSRAACDTGEVWVGVRPEKVFMSEVGDEHDSSVNTFSGGKVSDVSFIGMSTSYLVKMPWGQELTVFEQNSGARDLFAPGAAVDLHWNVAHTFLLDAAQDALAGVELVDG